MSYRITGEGTFDADRLSYRPLPEGMRVDTILARPGDVVQAGDTILTLQMEPLQEKREELAVALRQAELALEQERLSGREIPRVTQEMLALQQMEVDQRALELGRQDLADAQEDYDQNVDALRLEYDRLAGRSEDEIRQDAKNALKSARRVYDAAKLDRDSAVKLSLIHISAESFDNVSRAELAADQESGEMVLSLWFENPRSVYRDTEQLARLIGGNGEDGGVSTQYQDVYKRQEPDRDGGSPGRGPGGYPAFHDLSSHGDFV